MPTQEGLGAVLADFILSLDRQAAFLGPEEASRLGTVVIDLVATWPARELDAKTDVPGEARQRDVMGESIRAFIRRNLHDPDLSPPMVAAAHHISISYLHRLFSQQFRGETVAGWIRAQRLENARRDLADRALRNMPLHIVAARWGILGANTV